MTIKRQLPILETTKINASRVTRVTQLPPNVGYKTLERIEVLEGDKVVNIYYAQIPSGEPLPKMAINPRKRLKWFCQNCRKRGKVKIGEPLNHTC